MPTRLRVSQLASTVVTSVVSGLGITVDNSNPAVPSVGLQQPVTPLQNKVGRYDSDNPTITLSSNTTGGSVVLVAMTWQYSGATPVLSGLGATWTMISDTSVGGAHNTVWKGVGCTAGNTNISVAQTGGYACYTAVEFKNVATVSTPTVTGPSTGTTLTSTAASVSLNDAAFVAFTWFNNAAPTYSADSPSAWTSTAHQNNNNLSADLQCGYFQATGSATADRQLTIDSSQAIASTTVLLHP